jgi:type I restriction enzyme, S subunit
MKVLENTIPKGWEKKKIKDLLNFERPDNYIVKSDSYTTTAKTPVLTANKSFILGYTDEDFGICKNLPAIIFDDFTTDSKYVDFPFKIKSSAIKILRSKNQDVNLKFVFELIKSINFQAGNHKRYYISEYQDIDIIVPPSDEQKKIADILSTLDEEIKKTDEIISQTKKMNDGLMRELFTKGIGHKNFKKTKLGNIPMDWDVKKLGEVIFFENGKAHENFIDDSGNFIVVNSKFIAQDGNIVKKTNKALKILNKGDIAIVMSDIPQGRALAKCFFVDENDRYTLNQRIGLLRPISGDNKYFFYLLNRNKYFLNFSNETSQTNLRKQQVLDCPIAIPSVGEQKKIVEIISLIDKKTSINKKLKEKLTELKKGLMQDLLSGKVRLKIK